MNVSVFVQNVERLCREQGTTPTVACKESGAGKDTISDAKRRNSIPSIVKIQKLAVFFGVPTGDLLGEKKPTVMDDGLSDGELALMDLFRRLTPEQQDMVLRMVQAAADKQG